MLQFFIASLIEYYLHKSIILFLLPLYLLLILYTKLIKIKFLRGDKLTIKIKNSFLPIVVSIEFLTKNGHIENILVSLYPFEEKIIKTPYEGNPTIYGYKINPLFFINESPVRFFVLPLRKKRYPIKLLKASILKGNTIMKVKAKEGLEFYGIEEYKYGPARYINWKKSMKGKLYANIFHMEGHAKIVIAVVSSVINIEYWEYILDVLAFLKNYFRGHKIIVYSVNSKECRKGDPIINDYKAKPKYNIPILYQIKFGLIKAKPLSYKMKWDCFLKEKADLKIIITSKNYPIKFKNAITIVV